MAEAVESSSSVKLHIYDLSKGMAQQLSLAFLGKQIDGIWHTGIVVYGYEYYFGDGIQAAAPAATPFEEPDKTVDLGTTCLKQQDFHDYLRQISNRFTHETYSLLSHNCNSFTSEAAQFLTGKDIPKWISGLPEDALNSPMGQPIRQMLEAQERSRKEKIAQILPWQESSSRYLNLPPINNEQITKHDNPIDDEKNKYSAKHLHDTLQFSAIFPNSLPFLTRDNKYAVFYALINSASNKYKKTEDPIKGSRTLSLTLEEQSILKKSVEICIKQTSDKIGQETFALFDYLITTWKPSDMFAVLGLLRLFILRPEGYAYYREKDIAYFDPIIRLIPNSEETKHSEKKEESAPTTSQIMAVCTICNLFVDSSIANKLIKEQKVINMAKSAFCSKKKMVHLMGATLLYNCALYMPKTDGDSTLEIVSLLSETIPSETHHESCYRSLLALSQLVFQNSSCVMMVSDLSLSGAMYGKDSNLSAIRSKVQAVYNDIQTILNSEKDNQ